MTRRYGISEMLKMINDLPDPNARLQSLASCSNIIPVYGILKYMFDPTIKFALPSGAPPYKENENLDQQSNLYNEFRRLYLFIDGAAQLNPLKRETIFVQVLETIDPEDAKLIIAMKDKICPYPNITYDLVFHAFPGLLPPESEVPAKITEDLNIKTSKGKPCPFGCVSRNGNELYMPGPLLTHLRHAHKYDDVQIANFKQENSI